MTNEINKLYKKLPVTFFLYSPITKDEPLSKTIGSVIYSAICGDMSGKKYTIIWFPNEEPQIYKHKEIA